jgi:thioredoxin 1
MLQLTTETELTLTGLSVVKFSASWCSPCKKLEPILVKMEKEFPEVKVYSVDIDELTKLAKKYKILSVPSLLFFNEEKEVTRIVGLQPTEVVRKAFKSL